MEESRESASRKVDSYAVMNPVLWGSLPRELLVLVLARLPVPEITRLHCQLSKEWTMNMDFNRACDDWNPNMAALLSYVGQANEFSVRIIDFSKYKWLYEYRFRLTNHGNAPSWFDTIGTLDVWRPMASDGGLVCFVANWKYTEANPLCIVVINPLIRVQHELPPLQCVYTLPPTLMHMKVDSETKGYKVVVVGNHEDRHTVETYDSISRQWSRGAPSWGRILGIACNWTLRWHGKYFRSETNDFCACDLEEGQLQFFSWNSFDSEGAWASRHVLAGDRMFVLHRNKNRQDIEPSFPIITEFQFRKSAQVWVLVGTHGQCFPEEKNCIYDLLACEDVLMLRRCRFRFPNMICSFLNFSTREWYELPENSLHYEPVSLTCQVFWHVNP